MKIEGFVFPMYKGKNEEIYLIIDTFVPERHFWVKFKDEKELDKFVQFLKSPIVKVIE